MPKKPKKKLRISVEDFGGSSAPNDQGLAGGTPKHGLAGAPLLPGLTGLTNMGNTCYLNSSLQCLSHTVPMAQYFLNECWRGIVEDKKQRSAGPLVQGDGVLCTAYSELLKQLWMGERAVVRPIGLHEEIAKANPEFRLRKVHARGDNNTTMPRNSEIVSDLKSRAALSVHGPDASKNELGSISDSDSGVGVGSGQHDSHELLSVLLDRLHEELNTGASSSLHIATDAHGSISSSSSTVSIDTELNSSGRKLLSASSGSSTADKGDAEVDGEAPVLSQSESEAATKPASANGCLQELGEEDEGLPTPTRLDKTAVNSQSFRKEKRPSLDPQAQSRQAAAIAWHSHLVRNRSVIVDLFQGQLHSTLRCTDCGHSSTVYDPFQYLSVPLPTKPLPPLAPSTGAGAVPLAGASTAVLAESLLAEASLVQGGGGGDDASGGEERSNGGVAATTSAGADGKGGEGGKGGKGATVERPAIHLRDCLRAYCAPETLNATEEQGWLCVHCRKYATATQVLRPWRLPPVLVVQLKRFQTTLQLAGSSPVKGAGSKGSAAAPGGICSTSSSSSSGSGSKRVNGVRVSKICQPVQFPLRGLDMSEFVQDYAPHKGCAGTGTDGDGTSGGSGHGGDRSEFVYDLFAVCNHHSSGDAGSSDDSSRLGVQGSVQHGHYTSMVRNHLDSRWYHMNDGEVSQVSEAQVAGGSAQETAYLLFYALAKHSSSPSQQPQQPQQRQQSAGAGASGASAGSGLGGGSLAGGVCTGAGVSVGGGAPATPSRLLYLDRIKRHSLSATSWRELLPSALVGPHSPSHRAAAHAGAEGCGYGGSADGGEGARVGGAGAGAGGVKRRLPFTPERGDDAAEEQPVFAGGGNEGRNRNSRLSGGRIGSITAPPVNTESPILAPGRVPAAYSPPAATTTAAAPNRAADAGGADTDVAGDGEWWVLYHDFSGRAEGAGGVPYWYNELTGISSWTRPPGVTTPPGTPKARDNSSKGGATYYRSPSPQKIRTHHLSSKHRYAAAESPKSYGGRKSQRNGGRSSGSSSQGLELDPETVAAIEAAKVADAADAAEHEQRRHHHQQQQQHSPRPDWDSFDADAWEACNNNSDGSHSHGGEELARGWSRQFDDSSGYFYYTHTATGASTWTRPTERDIKRQERTRAYEIGCGSGSRSSSHGNYGNEYGGSYGYAYGDPGQGQGQGKDQPSLRRCESTSSVASHSSDVWEEGVDPDTGATYYYNWRDQRSTWKKPNQLKRAEADAVSQAMSAAVSKQVRPVATGIGVAAGKVAPVTPKGTPILSQREQEENLKVWRQIEKERELQSHVELPAGHTGSNLPDLDPRRACLGGNSGNGNSKSKSTSWEQQRQQAGLGERRGSRRDSAEAQALTAATRRAVEIATIPTTAMSPTAGALPVL